MLDASIRTVNRGLLPLSALLLVVLPTIAGARPLRAVATTTMVADLVASVGGDRVEVTGMMGPGVDPHLYKATPSDLTDLQRADVVFYNGLNLEGRLTDVFNRMARRGAKLYAVTERIPRDILLEPASFVGHYDPHVWFDPTLWALCVPPVVDGLVEEDPEGRVVFEANGDSVIESLSDLNEWALSRVVLVAPERRLLLTSHDAFNYFGRAYGFEVVGVQGISTVTEAGLADISGAVALIRERGIPAIFVESSVSPAAIGRISEDSGAVIGGELFSDAMGTPGVMRTVNGETYDEGTYDGMVRHNINAIVEALR
jgi:manganese/zinc/iron transport system substrate-binding protein